MSLSSRRAWIEILNLVTYIINTSCRSPHGERGLKSTAGFDFGKSVGCRSPHGERGLKLNLMLDLEYMIKVALLTESVD